MIQLAVHKEVSGAITAESLAAREATYRKPVR